MEDFRNFNITATHERYIEDIWLKGLAYEDKIAGWIYETLRSWNPTYMDTTLELTTYHSADTHINKHHILSQACNTVDFTSTTTIAMQLKQKNTKTSIRKPKERRPNKAST